MIGFKARWKRWFKSERVHSALGTLCAYYTRLVLITGRIECVFHENTKPYFEGEHAAIFALWHSRIMLIQSIAPKNRSLCALVSAHADGRLIGRVLQHYGINIVHGSTSRGGTQALRQLITTFKQGHNLAITPDGPRGPAEIASDGVAQLALLTNAPIICVSYAAHRHHRLRSWDRFMITLPFSKIYFYAAAPIVPHKVIEPMDDKHTQRKALLQTIQSTLVAITAQVDQRIAPQ